MKKLYLILSVLVSMNIIVSCQEEEGIMGGGNKIEQGNTSVSDVSYRTAIAATNVTTIAGNEITQHGHCWGTETNPEMSGFHSSQGSLKEAGSFSSNLENLQPNTEYYIRSFITTSYETIYGTESSFKTLKTGKPVIKTGEITEVTVNSAICSGEALSDSGLVITEYGIVWDTLEVFTYEKSLGKKQLGDSLGSFTHSLTDLVDGRNYRVKAYAKNEAGVGYGEVKTFATVPITIPSVTTAPITGITVNSAQSGGEVTGNGNAEVTARGIVWGTSANPTLEECLGMSTDSIGDVSYVSNLSDLMDNTTYYVRAYATNSKGTSYGDVVEFITVGINVPTVSTSSVANITINSAECGGEVISDGNAEITARGIIWSTSANLTLEENLGMSTDSIGDGSYVSNLSDLMDSTTYYVRAYATNSKGTGYGSVVEFITTDITIPTVITSDITGITSGSAQSGGEVTGDGYSAVTSRGIIWSTNSTPTITDNMGQTTEGSGTGNYTSQITNLQASTTYYVRAYATNSEGTAYGEEKQFVTLSKPFYVPDDNFRAFLKSIIPNAFIGDSLITDHPDVLAITNISVTEKNISSLEGIEHFTSLSDLYCGKNNLSNLDVSNNIDLTMLTCYENSLSNLDVSNNKSLTNLNCGYNNLSNLNVSNNTSLIGLSCDYNNLSNLDVSNNTALQYLDCYSNNLSSLDLSSNNSLIRLDCNSNQISALDVSNNTALTSLYCYLNNLISLDLSNNTSLTGLYCYRNNLSSLNVSNNTALTDLNCSENNLNSIDLINNTALTILGCSNNNLTILDISSNTALTSLHCYGNSLSNLDVSNNPSLDILWVDEANKCESSIIEINPATSMYFDGSSYRAYTPGIDCYSSLAVPDNNFRAYLKSKIPNAFVGDSLITDHQEVLTITSLSVAARNISSLAGIEYFTSLNYLNCSKNNLSSLDITFNKALAILYCEDNNISNLDVNNNTALTILQCSDNNLSSLDVSNNTALTELHCYRNNLNYLDVINNTALTWLSCSDNNLSNLDVSNNTSLTILNCYGNSLTNLDVSYNTDLTQLECSTNNLSNLDVSNNTSLTLLSISQNNISIIDISTNKSLTIFSCSKNSLSNLDVSNNSALTYLACTANNLSSLNVSNNTALKNLFCSKNNLTSLDVSNNTALYELVVDEVIKCESSIIEINPGICSYYNGGMYIEYFPGIDCGV